MHFLYAQLTLSGAQLWILAILAQYMLIPLTGYAIRYLWTRGKEDVAEMIDLRAATVAETRDLVLRSDLDQHFGKLRNLIEGHILEDKEMWLEVRRHMTMGGKP